MEVGGRGDCLAMDVVGGMDSLPQTPRGHRYILTIIDCFTRYAVAVPLVDQSAEVLIASVLGSWITVYGTPRRILTDQGRSFESDQFAAFCNLFRISKIRTTAYHPQSNGICERFNQTLKHSLAKILSKEQQSSWDLYLGFAVFSYNLSVHSSTGFTPFYLTFGSEARLPPDIIFGVPALAKSAADSKSGRTSGTGLSFLLKSFSILTRAFATVRENLRSFHQREKDRYDLGAVERVFKPGDHVRVRLKSRQKGPSKFLSHWSGPHEVLKIRGVVVTLRELSSGREYITHHDRLSNPILSGKKCEIECEPQREHNANPRENLREPEQDSEPRGNSEEALLRTRSGRVVRPTRREDFDYSGVISTLRNAQTSTSSPTLGTTCFQTSAPMQTSASVHSIQTSSSSSAFMLSHSFEHAQLAGNMPLTQETRYQPGISLEERESTAEAGVMPPTSTSFQPPARTVLVFIEGSEVGVQDSQANG